ncbi:MAG: FAD-dependent oxidoreductase [Micromonosporaceae bacterium]
MSVVVHTDVAVVGAGPAGMAAAIAAAGFGCEVALIDSAETAGGQIYRQSLLTPPGAAPSASRRMPERLRRVAESARIRHLPATTVWHAEPGGPSSPFVLHLADAAGRDAGPPDAGADLGQARFAGGPRETGRAPAVLQARAVVVATGAAELVVPFPGWDLPGVTTAGGAQALLKAHSVTVGARVLVAGSGPLLLPVAAALSTAGVRVVAVVEAVAMRAAVRRAPGLALHPAKLREAAGYAAALARHRVPVLTGRAVIACRGTDRVEDATIARLGGDWRPVPGTERHVTVDAVHVSFGLSPALEISRLLGCDDVPHPARPIAAIGHDADLATSVPGVFAAGEATGAAGADVAELEGYLAGASAARHAGRLTATAHAARTHGLRQRLTRARRFADLIDSMYPFMPGWLDWPAPDTIACRCEQVPWEAIGGAVAAGCGDVRSVKGVTRCGMGYCQGRVCGPILQYAVAEAAGKRLGGVGDLHSRPVASPVPLHVIAATSAAPSKRADPGVEET